MQGKVDDSIDRKMAVLRLVCNKKLQDLQISQQKADSALTSFRKSLHSVEVTAQEAVQNQDKVVKLKDHLREEEDDLVKALAVKTRKEAKHIAIAESLSATKAKVEELKRIVKDQRARRDEYKRIISQQLLELDEKRNVNTNHIGELEEAISWYNDVLGFRIEGGHGVKFIFKKIDTLNLNKEYCFTVRHENDNYTLLDCDPYLEDTKDLIHDLNKTNGLFKFVRLVREKFREAASNGSFQPSSPHQDTSSIATSAPASSVSVSSSNESPTIQNDSLVGSRRKVGRPKKKFNHGHVLPENTSPKSALSLRQSPRFKVKK